MNETERALMAAFWSTPVYMSEEGNEEEDVVTSLNPSDADEFTFYAPAGYAAPMLLSIDD